ncbi:alpha/beta fold hydrolase [Salipiger sp. P9]|uniref:alpha/beta fold hydrolase n=1 Tax=Salipiger pentaromativorans TaxID=2943193 RepID=UPI0021580F13|nr:alpha/beta hydrolase [Salipiger pentaromativorans]MCR8548852.1 alpha/beta fold hydrolase [Salipiger pentaromativorans]
MLDTDVQTLTITAADHRTNLHRAGAGKPVALLHGSGAGVSAWANWRKVIAPLSDSFDIIAPDIAGFGATELKPDAQYNIMLWVEHFIGILDALEIDKISVVGNSFGGALGLMTAINHPDRIDRLVLLGTPCGHFPLTGGLKAQGDFNGTLESMREAISWFPYDASFITEDLIQARFEAATRDGALEAFRKLMPPPTGENPIVRGIPEKLLRKVGHKTLILHGREDRVVPFERALDMHQWLDNSELHSFGRCGHWVQIEREAEFLTLVTDFLGEQA